MMRWFKALMPKEERFFELFARHSEAVLAGAEALRAMLEGGDAIQRNYQIVMDREQDADDVTREVLIAVRRTFITPFDRSDIHGLITAMDDTIDLMEETAQRIELYEVTDFTEEMKEMAESAHKCALIIRQTIPLLAAINKNSRQINELCVEVSKIEGQADRRLRQGLSKLIKGGYDPILILTRKEIYEVLESVIDRCEDVMDAVQGIVIEHV